MISCHIGPRLLLDFWVEKTPKLATVYCKKHSDERQTDECNKFPLISITNTGELKRHKDFPVGWGFLLTTERKIKEIR